MHTLPLYAELQEVVVEESPVAREVYYVALIPIIAFVLSTVVWVLMFGPDSINTALSGGLFFIPASCCCYACGSAGSESDDTASDEEIDEE